MAAKPRAFAENPGNASGRDGGNYHTRLRLLKARSTPARPGPGHHPCPAGPPLRPLEGAYRDDVAQRTPILEDGASLSAHSGVDRERHHRQAIQYRPTP